MKKIIVNFEKDKNSFLGFKKEKIKYEKVFVSPLWNFSKKNFIGGDLALDFRNLNIFEIPELSDLKKIKYIFINFETKNIFEMIKKSKKVIYSFSEEELFEEELKKLFKKDKNTLDKDFSKFLNNIYLEVFVEDFSEEELFKKIVFIKKTLLKILDKKSVEKIKILLKNNFSLEVNKEILENKLLKVDGVIME